MTDIVPLPRRHSESPPRRTFAIGRSENGEIRTFPASRPVLHDVPADPVTDVEFDPDLDLPSDRIVKAPWRRCSCGFKVRLGTICARCERNAVRPFGNGLLSSFEAKLPTPPEQTADALTASILVRIEAQLREIATAVGALADTLRDPKGGAA